RAGAQEVRRAVPGDRPGPRGRGNLLAPGRAVERAGRARRQGRASRRGLRAHAQRDPRSDLATAPPLAGPGERPAGAPRARLPGRLQPVAAAVEEGWIARRLRGPRTEP